MPKIGKDDTMKILNVGTFQFSGKRPEELEDLAASFTLATFVVDKSGSVDGFSSLLIDCVKSAKKALEKSDKSDNLLLRVVYFDSNIREVHGFLPLADIDESLYDDLHPSGMTLLYDAVYEGIGSVLEYSRDLQEQEIDCNGICVIITDGYETAGSKMTPSSIKSQVADAIRAEDVIESINTILIGINAKDYSSYLDDFKNEAGLDQFVDAGDANPENIAKVAGFISQSVSSQSQSLGTGGASQSLTF